MCVNISEFQRRLYLGLVKFISESLKYCKLSLFITNTTFICYCWQFGKLQLPSSQWYCWLVFSTTVWVKKIPRGFLTFFPKWLGIFSPNFTRLFNVPIYARLQIFIQLSATVTKLCHIKSDHPACVSPGDGYFEHMMWTGWSCLIWHNFVTVVDNWINICSLV